MSLDILLWAFLASFVIHIVDETTMNGGLHRRDELLVQQQFHTGYRLQ